MCTPTEALRIMDEVVHTCNLLFPSSFRMHTCESVRKEKGL